MNDYPQVGRGWAFPPRWVRPGTLVMSDGEQHIREALVVLLRTMLGSRVMRPGLGAGIDRYVFEPRTADACHRLADDVRRALLLGEPRVIVDAVSAVPAAETDDRVDVTVEYRIDRHRRPTSLVLPFYLEGAR
jgi:Bacteriophage baseplate protein W